MSKNTVRLAVEMTAHEGKIQALESLAQAMVAGSQKEPGTLGYEWHLSADRRRCRLLETYLDANAVLAHFTGPVVQQLVPKVLEVASLNRIEVYGDPGPQAAQMLAGFGAEIFPLWHGLER